MIQILHRGDIKSGLWFTISKVDCKEGTINWYDSIYNDLDKESKQQFLCNNEANWEKLDLSKMSSTKSSRGIMDYSL